ncbi:class II glutamine amidotransferase [Halomonas sp. GXIMD04776]|uniref:class II glutamine amidotransferase n=1 Tax=Halomonas sp. GXIMD04776 TaxID=3415605 RepID=UPI003C80FEDB
MCELFAMSSGSPTNVHYSLEEFSRRGGLAGPHKDGWGIAYYLDGDVRLVKEAEPASDSACIRFLQERPFSSELVVSHIRRATQGVRKVRNCQPFTRELGGAMHVFAHNGDLDWVRLTAHLPLGSYHPVGETDSEYAFCALLERLRALWLATDGVPALEDRLVIVSNFAAEIREFGPANFLYADGDALFAHGHKRTQGQAGIRPPGLHVLHRRCAPSEAVLETPGLTIESPDASQHVALFASIPLTSDPGWQALDEGELLAVRHGRVVARMSAEAAILSPGTLR